MSAPVRRGLLALLLWLAAATGARADDRLDDHAALVDPAQQILVLLQMPPEHFRPDSHYTGSYGDGLGRGARRRIAAQLARQHGLSLASDWPMPTLGVDCYVMTLAPAQAGERDALLLALERDPRVAWAQAMNLFRAQQPRDGPLSAAQPHDDPLSAAQPHDDPLYAVQPAALAWNLASLHQHASGRGVRVAVIDSGIEVAHPDLAGQVEFAENFVGSAPAPAERHGTEVAGIIVARADNRLGIAGIAPAARLLALRACWQQAASETLCTSLSLARALDAAIERGAQVINLSLAGAPDALLARLIDIALRRGIAVVAAVDRSLPRGGFPASHAGVLAVDDDASAAAPAPGVLRAPGRDVPTTGPPSRWYLVSGTSYAAAHVSGLMALLREADPRAAPAAADIVQGPGGAIDACATLARGLRACACACGEARAATPPLALH